VAFFFRDRFVFYFFAAGPERFVGFLFGLAMAIDPYLKSALRFGMRRQREHARMIRKTEKGEKT
jgi:hypothetical protein